MEMLSVIWNYGIPFLLVLTVLVFVHELGHYLLARRFGVRVEVFSIGFGPEIFGWTDRAQTRWKFSLVPLGGYVKMFGDADYASTPSGENSTMTAEERACAFHHKSLGQRSWIVAGGPLANFIFAFLVLGAMFSLYGQQVVRETGPTDVGMVMPDSAAADGGLMEADRILAVNGQAVEKFKQIVAIVEASPGKPLEFLVQRGDLEERLTITPRPQAKTSESGETVEVGRIGISNARIEYVRHDPLTAFWLAGSETVRVTTLILEVVGQFFTGSRSTDELAGPLGIAQFSGEVAQQGLDRVIFWLALLSINLGLLNLFPIPMLDGGHLLFYAIEAARGQPLGQRAQEFGFRIGLALVLALMLFATWNDIVRLTY